MRRKFTPALGARYKVQQGEHGEQRNEREGDSHRIGLFKPNVEEHLGDEGNSACDEAEQPCGFGSISKRTTRLGENGRGWGVGDFL